MRSDEPQIERDDLDERRSSGPRKARQERVHIHAARFASSGYSQACRSGKAEAVVKIPAGGWLKNQASIDKCARYIARVERDGKEEVELETQDGEAIRGREAVDERHKQWAEQRTKGKQYQRQPRQAVHIILSASAEDTPQNRVKTLAAARQVCQEFFGERGYEFSLGLHQDSGHPHVHALVKCKSRDREQGKLRLNKPELFAMRTRFAEKLKEMGLEHVATLRRDRPHVLEQVKRGVERLEKRERQHQRAMRRAAPTRNAFAHRKSMQRAICKMREKVKDKTKPMTPQRREALAKLRTFERQLKKQDKKRNVEKEVQAALRGFAKDLKQLSEYRQDLQPPSKLGALRDSLRGRGRKAAGKDAVEKMAARNAAELRIVEAEVRLDPALGREQKVALQKELKESRKYFEHLANGRTVNIPQKTKDVATTVSDKNRTARAQHKPDERRELLAWGKALNSRLQNQSLEKQYDIVRAEQQELRHKEGWTLTMKRAAWKTLKRDEKHLSLRLGKDKGKGVER